MATKLKHLGKQSKKAITKLDLIPWDGGIIDITLHATEFTSHCPVTGQPDFARFEITYRPTDHIVETKSMKLYLWQYRDQAEFNEALVSKIAGDLYAQIKPHSLVVTGHFNVRGGIAVSASCHRGSRI